MLDPLCRSKGRPLATGVQKPVRSGLGVDCKTAECATTMRIAAIRRLRGDIEDSVRRVRNDERRIGQLRGKAQRVEMRSTFIDLIEIDSLGYR
jgi:hypothetical protein